jgi:hypothetical protein
MRAPTADTAEHTAWMLATADAEPTSNTRSSRRRYMQGVLRPDKREDKQAPTAPNNALPFYRHRRRVRP